MNAIINAEYMSNDKIKVTVKQLLDSYFGF